MAGVAGVLGDNSPSETDDSTDKTWSNGRKHLRINGLHTVYTNGEKMPRTMDNKRLKLSVMRVNGSQNITVKPPGQTLKIRGDSLTVNNTISRTRRHSARHEPGEYNKRSPTSPRFTRSSQPSVHTEVVLLSPTAKPSSATTNNNHIEANETTPPSSSSSSSRLCDPVTSSSSSSSSGSPRGHHSGSRVSGNSSKSPPSQWTRKQQHITAATATAAAASSSFSSFTFNGADPLCTKPVAVNGCIIPTATSTNSSSNNSSSGGGSNKANECSGLVLPISPDTSRSCTPLSCTSVVSPLGLECTSPILQQQQQQHQQSLTLPASTTTQQQQATSPSVCTSSNGLSRSLSRLDSQCSQSSQSSDSQSHKTEDVGECRWHKCTVTVDPTALTDHIKEQHVDTQTDKQFVCLWQGCKVYNKASSSQSWLERHVASHSGNKPFKCIFEGCGMRFPSQFTLERHVQSHFNTYQALSNKHTGTPSKLKKKRAKRKYAYQVKREDYFDSRSSEEVRCKLVALSQLTNPTASHVTFHSTVIAKRTEASGTARVLLTWKPPNLLADEWIDESVLPSSGVPYVRSVPLSSLPQPVHPSLYSQHRYRKHRRK